MDAPFSPLAVKHLMEQHGIKLVLFGDTHGFVDDEQMKIALFRLVKPEFLLHEMIEDRQFLTAESQRKALIHDPDERYSLISTWGEIIPIITTCSQFKIPLVGIDFKDMGRKDMAIFSKEVLTGEDEREEDELQTRREHKHATVINEYLKKNSSFIVASVGAWHLRSDSNLLSNIDCEKYLIIYPSIDGTLMMNPEGTTPAMISYRIHFAHKKHR